MELLYPGYKAYYDRFRTDPFRTEYTTRYCKTEKPVLYTQVPQYSWNDPRRPISGFRYESDQGTKLTHLRPPFAARMTSYIIDQKKERQDGLSKRLSSKNELLKHEQSSYDQQRFLEKEATIQKLPQVSEKGYTPRTRATCSQQGNLAAIALQMARVSLRQPLRKHFTTLSQQEQFIDHSSSQPSRSPLQLDNSALSGKAVTKEMKTSSLKEPGSLQRHNLKVEQKLGIVAPRPATLLSKHPNCTRYVRDTCFFHPTRERKKQYYIVNPNWFSEQRTEIPKNNVFS